jgi:hypothetical protein
MPETKPKFVVTVTGQRYDGEGMEVRVELEATAENRETISAYRRDPNRTNLQRLIGPSADLFKDGWVADIPPD